LPESSKYGELQIDVKSEPAQITLRLQGEVDLSNAEGVEEAINSASGENTAQVIVVDLGGLTFIDSTGLSVLIGATRRSRQNGNHLHVRGASGQVLRILEVAGVHEWLLAGDSAKPD
jgi:anti-sigma B factor antagonist